jgi:hypothetical protein
LILESSVTAPLGSTSKRISQSNTTSLSAEEEEEAAAAATSFLEVRVSVSEEPAVVLAEGETVH